MLPRLREVWRAWWPYIVAGASVLLAFLAGRAAAPLKVLEREVHLGVEYRQKLVIQQAASKQEESRVVYRDRWKLPDGTERETTVEGTHSVDERREEEFVDEREERIVYQEKERLVERAPGWRIGPVAAVDVRHLQEQQLLGPVALGLSVTAPPLGPVSAGGFVLSSGVFGLSAAIEF